MNQVLKGRALESLKGRWLLACIVALIYTILVGLFSGQSGEFVHITLGGQTQVVKNDIHTYSNVPWEWKTYTWTAKQNHDQNFTLTTDGWMFTEMQNQVQKLFPHQGFSIGLVDFDTTNWLESVWNILVEGSLTLGLASIFLQFSRNEETKIEDLFAYFTNGKLFVRGIVSYILPNIYLILWTLLFIIPGIIKSFSYAMTNYILIDNPDYSVDQAITESRRMMDGHKFDLFLLMLSFIGWYILAALTLGIGLIWLNPYIEATRAQFYLHISGKNNEVEVV